jgi:UDP-N-acetylmuramoyl-tripeptide--D-alanyl-D-alanine ligase
MLLLLLVIGVWGALALELDRRLMQFFQIEEYDNRRFLRWAKQHAGFFLRLPILLTLALWLLSFALDTLTAGTAIGSLLLGGLWLTAGAVLLVLTRRRKTQIKKPLVYTDRVKRILAVTLVVQLLLPLLYLLWYLAQGGAWLVPAPLPISQRSIVDNLGMAVSVGVLLTPLALVLANLLLAPFEAAMRAKYARMARAVLDQRKAVALAITGSYGKTSTKDILAEMLAMRYNVVKSPQSYNTLMGICKIINRGDVQPHHDYFVVEAGAYTTGEIASIVQLVRPQVGVITAIGPQHLERFGTVENVAKAKYEIMSSLPADGLAVFNADDERAYALARQTTHVPVALYGFRQHHNELTTRADEVHVSAQGTGFTLTYAPTGECVAVQTRLLGLHTVSNILAAATVALHCGVPLPDVAQAISRLEPTPHRLELKPGAGGTIILDDAYNSNPVGARNALDVLRMFTQGQRILVTPGFVELGPIEAAENRTLGMAAATACDYAILVGGAARTDPIRDGLVQAGFTPERIFQVDSLQAGIAHLHRITHAGDAILLLNDLPDTYELVAA